MKSSTRRRVVQSVLYSSGAALCPWASVFGQSGGSTGLLRAPKQALVIGNSRYKLAPLRNPPNDARDLTAALKSVGFDVTLGLELTQAELRVAITAYTTKLVKSKSVGLFYFAGHGVQLAWRNYLIPVDAEIASIEELRERAIDLNGLIEGIRKAANPMNIVILDACRDNPFGGRIPLERGLSQLDAPAATLLAYATAPGNTAVDGDGDNGLYTEHLLREMKVPEAKVEDVFKRVRLAVRRRSNGQQIPWESTSLEEDFWFIPPAQIRRLADAEAEREYRDELALWERIQGATEPGPLEDYLRRYPSGRFSELAQLRIDQVLLKQGEKRIDVVSSPNNPYATGTARTDTAYRIGDTYSYRRFDMFTKKEDPPETFTVASITGREILFANGAVTDLLGNTLRTSPSIGAVWGPNQINPTEFSVGKRWTTRFDVINRSQENYVVTMELVVVERAPMTVPAGTFNAFRVEGRGRGRGPKIDNTWTHTRWWAPEQVRHWIAGERLIKSGPRVFASQRSELVSFKQS